MSCLIIIVVIANCVIFLVGYRKWYSKKSPAVSSGSRQDWLTMTRSQGSRGMGMGSFSCDVWILS